MTGIGLAAFYKSSDLTSVTIPSTVTYLDGWVFALCPNLANVVIPEEVTSIGELAFSNCTTMTRILIPDKVTTIGEQAFENCVNLTELILGKSVSSIETLATLGCSALTTVICRSIVPPTPGRFALQFPNTATIYVPNGTVETYTSTDGWSDYASSIVGHTTLDQALNAEGGAISFTSSSAYYWTTKTEDGVTFAQSTNGGVHNSTSWIKATITVPESCNITFKYKGMGEGTQTIYDKCIFTVDGQVCFNCGANGDAWLMMSSNLSPGTHTLMWSYKKDNSVNPEGDYFAVCDVQIHSDESYAVYTPDDSTLTFYHDKQRYFRSGTSYDLVANDFPQWRYDDINSSVTQVVFDPSFANARPVATDMWFYDMSKLDTIIGIDYLNTSEVTSMAMMFAGCVRLHLLDVSNFNTSKVTDMYAMFNAVAISSIDLRNFDTSKVTDMEAMFYGSAYLTDIDMSNFNTSRVTSMKGMFYYCNSVKDLDLTNFNTSMVVDMSNMFNGCTKLETIKVSNQWNTEAVTISDNMFTKCTSLVGGQGTVYDADHVDVEYAHIDGGTANPGYFTAAPAILRGDVDGNGGVNINDVTTLIDYLLDGGGSINTQAADCDQNGTININDVTTLIDYLLNGYWP